MNKSPLSLRSERGFSLLQVIVIGGFVLALAAGTLSIMDSRSRSLKLVRMANRMSLVEDQVKNAAQSLSAMYFSATQHKSDAPFARCLMKGDCRSQSFDAYDLYSSFGEPVSGAVNIDGTHCAADPKNDCPLMITTSFQILCAEGAATCTQPEAIITRYEIKQAKTGFTKGFKLKERTGTVSLAGYLCAAGEYVSGIDANGKLICDKARVSNYGLKCNSGAGFALTDRAELRCAEVTNFCNVNLSLVAVLDTSGSMNGSKLTDAKAGVDLFLSKLKTQDQAGVVSFGSVAVKNKAFDADKLKVGAAVKALKASGATNMTAGLAQAAELIAASPAGAVKGVVFLSDGWHNVGEPPFAEAAKLKAAGVRIWTVGLGNGADAGVLQRIASTPDDYAFAKNGSDLAKIYESFATTMCRN